MAGKQLILQVGAVGALLLVSCPPAFGQWWKLGFGSSCGSGCCDKEKCPPPYIHHQEGPPRLKVKQGCGKPVCDPCTLPHYGYFQTCWRGWPFAPDWSHCPVPPPGAYANGTAPVVTAAPATPPQTIKIQVLPANETPAPNADGSVRR